MNNLSYDLIIRELSQLQGELFRIDNPDSEKLDSLLRRRSILIDYLVELRGKEQEK